MRKFTATALTLYLLAAGFSYAAELDNYYLEQFGESVPTATKAVLKSASAPQLRKCDMPVRKAVRNDWNKLENSTQKTLSKYLSKPVLLGESTASSSGGHFIIHYATTGSDLPNPVAPYTVASWVQKVADTFEEVYAKEATPSGMGYSPPATPYHVYLQQLANRGAFGFTDPVTDSNNFVILTGQSASSYITIDNDFSDSLYHPYNGLPGLQITAAHEFHHAIQYFYNYFFESWYAEATSTWMEDEAYDTVNQLYTYSSDYLLSPTTSLNTPVSIYTGGGYGRWIFNRLIAENHNTSSIRLIWEKLRNTSSNGNDIQMIPVINSSLNDQSSSFSNEFSLFAKRLYKQDWTSHTNELSLLYNVPLAINATYTNFPVNTASSPLPTATLPAYSFGYYKFQPTNSSVPINLRISLSATAGLNVTALKKTTGGIITEYPLTTNGGPLIIDSFGVPGVSE
ncbi:MAG: hypothetical protein FIA91_09295, partial [Geobacter sp.]|nr:hypothetical protein [Geobacter sp.]